MTSSLGGDDESHDLSPAHKDREEKRLRKEARELMAARDKKARNQKLNRANEVSRKKAKKAHKGSD